MNVRPATIQLLCKNIGENLLDIGLREILFFGSDSKGNGNKSKNKQMGLYQTKKLLYRKETINKIKRQPTEWEKIFENHISDKRIISKLDKELIQLNKNSNNPIKKWEEDLNLHVSKEDIQVAKRHLNRCSTSLIIM